MSDADDREKAEPLSERRAPSRRAPPSKNTATLLGLAMAGPQPDLGTSPQSEVLAENANTAAEETPASAPPLEERSSLKPADPSKFTPAANFISASSFAAEPEDDPLDDIEAGATPEPWQAARKPALKVMTDRFPTKTVEPESKRAAPEEAVPVPVKRSLLVPGLIAGSALVVVALVVGVGATPSTREAPANSEAAAAPVIAAPTTGKPPTNPTIAAASASGGAAIDSPRPSSAVSAIASAPIADTSSSAAMASSAPKPAQSSRPLKQPAPVGDPDPY